LHGQPGGRCVLAGFLRFLFRFLRGCGKEAAGEKEQAGSGEISDSG